MVGPGIVPIYGGLLSDELKVRRLTEPCNITGEGVLEFAFSESGREHASVWETTRTTLEQAIHMASGGTRTASVTIRVSLIKSVSVEYHDRDGNKLAYNPAVIWSDPGPSVPAGTPGREGHADIYPMVPIDPDVSNKKRKLAERFLRTELARHSEPEAA